jgi:hypothetical protein
MMTLLVAVRQELGGEGRSGDDLAGTVRQRAALAMTGLSVDVARMAESAGQRWHTYYALAVTEALVAVLTTAVVTALGLGVVIKSAVVLFAVALAYLAWRLSNRLPRTKKGKVGFVISIAADAASDPSKIRDDFALTLHELLKGGESGRSFHVMKLPEYRAARIVDQDDAQQLRVRCRAHFVIYGRVRLRTIDGRRVHVLHLEGLVAHRSLPPGAKEGISREFAELFPRRVHIAAENDVFSFEFTSEWVNCVARYMIGIAAALSGDLDYAERLYGDTLDLLRGKPDGFPVFRKLSQRLPYRLSEIHLARAVRAYRQWTTLRDETGIAAVARHLDLVTRPDIAFYHIALLRSIVLFVRDRDVKSAIALLRKHRSDVDGTGLYNMGFLYAYAGDLNRATQCYRNAARHRTEPTVIADVEGFICWVLAKEPERYQLHYCLGFINWFVNGDPLRAATDLDAFLSGGREEEFPIQRQLAREWLSEATRANVDLRDSLDAS